MWLNDAIRIRIVFSSLFSVLVESHFYWTHITCDLLFSDRHHLLHPIWWRHFTPVKYGSRDLVLSPSKFHYLSETSLSSTFLFFKYDTVLIPCRFRRIVFRGHVVNSAFVQRIIFETMKDNLCSTDRRRYFEWTVFSLRSSKKKGFHLPVARCRVDSSHSDPDVLRDFDMSR